MKGRQLVAAGLVLAGIGAALIWAGAGRRGAWLTSERPNERSSEPAEEAPGVQAPRPGDPPAPSSHPGSARRAPPAKTAQRTAPVPKGRSLFDGAPLARPAPAPSTPGAVERADQGAQARSLSPRAERRLASMRARLETATGEERKHLQIAIESLENNLGHRRERERWAPKDASRN
ncbi:MAG: hypothetical protein JW940_07515 [Polyangiaceae bacterium]|nr:hypothetical protein [Polyangiaceae bacterium]